MQHLEEMIEWADENTVSSGLEWYSVARRMVRRSGFPLGMGAGIMAVVSPAMDWSGSNVGVLADLRDVGGLAGAWETAGAIRQTTRYARSKVGRLLAGERPTTVMPFATSPKTHSFYRNIVAGGGGEYVTIDGRMADMVVNERRAWNAYRSDIQRVGMYDVAGSVVRSVGVGRGWTGAQTQAVLWEIGRKIERLKPTADGGQRVTGVPREGQPYWIVGEGPVV